MARINVEDSLFKEKRFSKLLLKTGDMDRAIGALVRAWALAQKYWLTPSQLVPLEVWEREEINPALLECGFAEKRELGIYVSGSKDQFGWLTQRSEAGKKGGLKTKEKRPKRPKATESGRQATVNDSKPLSLSLSLSQSPSQSLSPSILYSVGEGAGAPPAPPEIKSPVGFFIANYVNAYQQRYGGNTRPSLAGKVQGQIKRFIEETEIHRACELIQTYCQMSDPWFLTKAHDFTTFMENLNKVSLKLDTGRVVTRTEAHAEDRKQATFNVFDDIIQEQRKKEGSHGK